jgi:sec-independent protein translocase protein TatA
LLLPYGKGYNKAVRKETMFRGFGPEWLVILAIILLLFGATRLPQLGRALGQTVRELRKGLKEGAEEEKPAAKEPAKGGGDGPRIDH